MNYGRFFRLNQNLSKIVDGVSIYDYIDLPAYFSASENNLMSPKYPISVTITHSAVSFRLHYSVYKIENEDGSTYGYRANDMYFGETFSANDVKIAHMEEEILELPYVYNNPDTLVSTIKQIYYTKFPLKEKDNSYGGRFLEQIIRKRYQKTHGRNIIENNLYDSIRKVSRDIPSYSSLWLMDMLDEEGDSDVNLFVKDDVVKFLRKLLLDFMFDMSHSDVFLNSKYYQNMYSGLMSNFYFSSLLHKCDYYYYRDLIRTEIELDELTEEDKVRIICLYADNLRISEDLWTQDIMNPLAERYFDYINPDGDDNQHNSFFVKARLLEDNHFIPRDSWFAEPEEEMRRVCFPMDERGGSNIYICNANTLLDFLKTESPPKVELELDNFAETKKEVISRWFLTRYDFSDVCHLHLSRKANLASFLTLFAVLLLFVVWRRFSTLIIDGVDKYPYLPTFVLCPLFVFLAILSFRRALKYKKRGGLMSIHIKKNSRRLTFFFGLLAVFWGGINYGRLFLVPILFALIFMCFPKTRVKLEHGLRRMTSYLHLLFPRLIASITTAWLTMTMGFDIYVAFFDQEVSAPTAVMILVIVFVFVMYELNRINPKGDIWKKLLRSLQLVTISYTISLIVGFVVIDFVGRQYMDRGDGFSNLTTKTAVLDEGKSPTTFKIEENSFGDINDKSLQNNVIHDNYRQSSIRVFHLGEHEVFFMRDFLIMFSFVTMFMGIFLQMFIFDDKKMTEF